MPAPEWGSFLSIVDGFLNPVLVSDLDQVVLKELMAENPRLTLPDLKKRSEYSSVTTMSGEFSDEQETPAVSTPLADVDDQLSEFPGAIPPAHPEVLPQTHSAFLAQLLMDEVDLGESTPVGLMTMPSSQCRPQMALQVRYVALNPHLITCASLGTTYRISSRFYELRLRVSSDGPAWTSSRGPGKRLYGPRRMIKKCLSPILRYPWYTPFTMCSRVARTGRMFCTLKLWGV